MKLIVKVKLSNNDIRKYLINAEDKKDAAEKVKLRLHPKERESCTIESITLDPSQYIDDDIHGTFLN